MKKYLRLIYTVLIVLFIFSACNSSDPTVIPEYSSEMSSMDLGGYTLKWGWALLDFDGAESIFGYIPGTAFADTALERIKEIEKSLNCVIDMEYKSTGDIGSHMQASVLSDTHSYELMTSESYHTISYVRSGYFTGLSSLLDLSETDKWGTPSILQAVTYKDDVYSVVPYSWPDLLYTTFYCPIVVNETLISRYGHVDPREFVEGRTWTWDKFEESIQAYTINDGERKIYGIASHPAYYSMMMFLSNGVSVAEETESGVVCGVYTNAGIEAMERARKIRTETCVDCFNPLEHTEDVINDFENGNNVLLVTYANSIIGRSGSSILYNMANVGILPFPQGPNAEPGVYPSYYETLRYSTSIPVNARDPEIAVIVLDRMFEPFEGYETKEDIIAHFSNQVFFDERDVQVYINMFENSEYGYRAEGARVILEQIMGNASVTEVLEKQENIYNDLLEDIIKPHYQGRLAVYGE